MARRVGDPVRKGCSGAGTSRRSRADHDDLRVQGADALRSDERRFSPEMPEKALNATPTTAGTSSASPQRTSIADPDQARSDLSFSSDRRTDASRGAPCAWAETLQVRQNQAVQS